MTDLSDYKKIGVVLKNRWVFDEHCIFTYLSHNIVYLVICLILAGIQFTSII